MSSSRGGIADVGESRCTSLPGVKSKCFRKTMSRSSDHGCSRVLWEKCASLCRVYKIIMVSRVPGYGLLEYLVLESIDVISSRYFNEFVGLMMIILIGI